MEPLKRLIQKLAARLRPHPDDSDPAGGPAFQVRAPAKETLLFRTQGDQPLFTQVALGLVRKLPSPMGLVLVEYRPEPREWTSVYLGRARTLSALVKIRDLLGVAGIDVAVVSPPLGLEIIVDHLGVLEIRTGAWNEALVRQVFKAAGYTEDRSPWEDGDGEPAELVERQEDWVRIEAVIRDLKLKRVIEESRRG